MHFTHDLGLWGFEMHLRNCCAIMVVSLALRADLAPVLMIVMIPTDDQIRELLDQLDTHGADDHESEVLEFKPWEGDRNSRRVAVDYTACMANTQGGVIVFGVRDRVVGRRCKEDIWKRSIFENTTPHLNVTLSEIEVPEGTGRLLVVRVPKGEKPPYGTAKGLFQRRVGKNCMPLDAQVFARRQVTVGALDWSGLPAEGCTEGDLDIIEIECARRRLRSLAPESPLLSLEDHEFLQALGVLREDKVNQSWASDVRED